MRLSFRSDRGFLLTYPPRTSKRSIQRFLDEQSQWMEKVRQERIEAIPSLRQYLEAHPSLNLDGERMSISFDGFHRWMKKSEHHISFHREITDTILGKQLKKLAKDPLTSVTTSLAEQKRVSISWVTVRDQSSRWGSCSSRGSISLNWRLILMPRGLQQHIILHELAHRVHPNHSSSFWNLLKSWDSNFEEHVQLLKERGKIWIRLGQSANNANP